MTLCCFAPLLCASVFFGQIKCLKANRGPAGSVAAILNEHIWGNTDVCDCSAWFFNRLPYISRHEQGVNRVHPALYVSHHQKEPPRPREHNKSDGGSDGGSARHTSDPPWKTAAPLVFMPPYFASRGCTCPCCYPFWGFPCGIFTLPLSSKCPQIIASAQEGQPSTPP